MIIPYSQDSYRFPTIREFQTSMHQGAEVVIEREGGEYGIWSEGNQIRITCADYPNRNRVFETTDEVLEYSVGNDRLRDVITQATVLDRTI